MNVVSLNLVENCMHGVARHGEPINYGLLAADTIWSNLKTQRLQFRLGNAVPQCRRLTEPLDT